MGQKTSKDQREFTRVPIHADLDIKAGELVLNSQVTRDISMKGIYVEGRHPLSKGDICDLVFRLGGGDSSMQFNVRGRVVRIDQAGMAIQFTELNIDAYDHLHNLVLLNCDNPDEIEAEFSKHVGLKGKK